jgi:hypothetical protein
LELAERFLARAATNAVFSKASCFVLIAALEHLDDALRDRHVLCEHEHVTMVSAAIRFREGLQ